VVFIDFIDIEGAEVYEVYRFYSILFYSKLGIRQPGKVRNLPSSGGFKAQYSTLIDPSILGF